jgi:hypothetical protein
MINRKYWGGSRIQSIYELQETDAFVFSSALSSGYLDLRARITLVAQVKLQEQLEFCKVIEQTVSTGNIYKIIQNA